MDDNGPLPAVLMAPWLVDNEQFQQELLLRDLRFEDIKALRERICNQIRAAEPALPCPLRAVDAASITVPLGDQLSILLQTIHIGDDGTPTLSDPQRVTGVNGHELRLVETPIRVAAECRPIRFPMKSCHRLAVVTET